MNISSAMDFLHTVSDAIGIDGCEISIKTDGNGISLTAKRLHPPKAYSMSFSHAYIKHAYNKGAMADDFCEEAKALLTTKGE